MEKFWLFFSKFEIHIAIFWPENGFYGHFSGNFIFVPSWGRTSPTHSNAICRHVHTSECWQRQTEQKDDSRFLPALCIQPCYSQNTVWLAERDVRPYYELTTSVLQYAYPSQSSLSLSSCSSDRLFLISLRLQQFLYASLAQSEVVTERLERVFLNSQGIFFRPDRAADYDTLMNIQPNHLVILDHFHILSSPEEISRTWSKNAGQKDRSFSHARFQLQSGVLFVPCTGKLGIGDIPPKIMTPFLLISSEFSFIIGGVAILCLMGS